jgi:hypothetical protein
MTPRAATRALLWLGAKQLSGDEWTSGELELFKDARQSTIPLAEKLMRLKPTDYAYTPGQPYEA